MFEFFSGGSPAPKPPKPHTLNALLRPHSVIALAALAAAAGCASPGPPRAPSLHLPSPATGLEARRIGPEVQITWTTPPNTTDGDANPTSLTAVLCRETSTPRSSCKEIARVNVSPGPSQASDPLPPALVSGPPVLLTYRVELLNARGRSAGQSAAVYSAAGQAPAPLGPLTIAPIPTGALITWAPLPGQPPVQLQRTLSGATAATTKPKRATAEKTRLFEPSPKNPGTTALLATRNGADPGGVLDPTVQELQTYTYTAQRVRSVQLTGHTVELRGLPSPPTTFTQRDTFPPTPPSGLVSIPAGGYGTPFSIDLSWDPSPERDILGYLIYRSQNGSPFAPLTPKPVTVPAFRDQTVAPGIPYTYRVTALNQHHNESAPSPEVHETLSADQKR